MWQLTIIIRLPKAKEMLNIRKTINGDNWHFIMTILSAKKSHQTAPSTGHRSAQLGVLNPHSPYIFSYLNLITIYLLPAILSLHPRAYANIYDHRVSILICSWWASQQHDTHHHQHPPVRVNALIMTLTEERMNPRNIMNFLNKLMISGLLLTGTLLCSVIYCNYTMWWRSFNSHIVQILVIIHHLLYRQGTRILLIALAILYVVF